MSLEKSLKMQIRLGIPIVYPLILGVSQDNYHEPKY